MSSFFPAADKSFTFPPKDGNPAYTLTHTLPAHFERSYNGCTLKYAIKFFPGNVPSTGYPLYIGLHGGGGDYEYNNDKEWIGIYNHFFSDPVEAHTKDTKDGAIFIAPRGVTEQISDGVFADEWKLHFEPEGYVMLEQVIKSWISTPPPIEMQQSGVPETEIAKIPTRGGSFCDPDRVYLLGFSAGGDGAFQLSARMPDLFAGVFIGGGHANWVDFANLINLPLIIGCGERDTLPNDPIVAGNDHSGVHQRAIVNYQDHEKLYGLQSQASGSAFSSTLPSALAGVVSGVFSHSYTIFKNVGHNSWAQPEQRTVDQQVVADLDAWYNNHKNGITSVPTPDPSKPGKIDPVSTLSPRPRNPYPNCVWWNLSTRPDAPKVIRGSPVWFTRKFNYWLCIRTEDEQKQYTDLVKAAYNHSTNSVWVDQAKGYLGLLINNTMLNLDQPIHVYVGTKLIGDVVVRRDGSITADTRHRSDPRFVFEAMIGFTQTSGDWKPEYVDNIKATIASSLF